MYIANVPALMFFRSGKIAELCKNKPDNIPRSFTPRPSSK